MTTLQAAINELYEMVEVDPASSGYALWLHDENGWLELVPPDDDEFTNPFQYLNEACWQVAHIPGSIDLAVFISSGTVTRADQPGRKSRCVVMVGVETETKHKDVLFVTEDQVSWPDSFDRDSQLAGAMDRLADAIIWSRKETT